MSSFRSQQTYRRYSGGYWDNNGEWNDGTYEELTFMASVQPLNQQEVAQYVEMMPSGGVNFSAVKIYSNTPLRVEKQAQKDGTPLQEADVLVWRGRLWKVIQCEDWQSNVINHFRMVAWEIEPDESDAEPEDDSETADDTETDSTVDSDGGGADATADPAIST